MQGRGRHYARYPWFFICSQIQIKKTNKSEEQSWKKENTHFTTDIRRWNTLILLQRSWKFLNISYNKEHYMFDQQHQRNNTVLFLWIRIREGVVRQTFIADSGRDIASDITTEIWQRRKRKSWAIILSWENMLRKQQRNWASAHDRWAETKQCFGKNVKENESSWIWIICWGGRCISAGSDYIPTQMETQNSIMKKRTGEVRLPSDNKAKTRWIISK